MQRLEERQLPTEVGVIVGAREHGDEAELQQRNSELLSLVREMTAERESAEIHQVRFLSAYSMILLKKQTSIPRACVL